MRLEDGLGQAVESDGVQISEQDRERVKSVLEHFRRESHQKEGIEGVYQALFLLNMAITSGAINPKNYADCQAVLSGKIPFYVQKGIVSTTEYFFCGKKGYRTQIRVFSAPQEAFNPVSVDGIRD